VFDHTKWIFYAATCYTWLGDDEPAEEHARELIADHTRPDGSSNAPMRTAMSHIDLGLIRARHGDLDEAVHHGLTAFSYDRKTEASLLSHATDLDQLLSDRYPASTWPPSSTSATRMRGRPCDTCPPADVRQV
jgi:hypothetical protein